MAAVGFTVPGYSIIAKFKEGGSAGIYKATKHPFEETVALKVLLPQHVSNKEMTRAFLQEATILQEVRHANIIRFHKVVDDAPRPTIEMEFFVSDHVKWILKKKNEQGDKLSVPTGLKIMRKVADALAYLHERGIAHRDLKPENILVNAEGEVRLIDFSIAERFPAPFWKKIFAGKPKVSGTLTYLAPEQIMQKPADQRADLYSFGVVLYEVLTGAPPFRATDPSALVRSQLTDKPVPPRKHRDDISPELDELVMRLLQKVPEGRIQTCADMLKLLDQRLAESERVAG